MNGVYEIMICCFGVLLCTATGVSSFDGGAFMIRTR